MLFMEGDLSDEPVSPFEPRTQLSPASSPRSKSKVEVETTEEEVYFAIYCFFNDLNQVRDFVHDLWCQYQKGSFDLVTTSVTMNAALELVRRAESELAASFPKCDTYEGAGLLLYTLILILLGRSSDGLMTDDLEYLAPEAAEWLFLQAYMLLDNIVEGFPATASPSKTRTFSTKMNCSEIATSSRPMIDGI